jgi:hypothetical protein
VTVAANGTFTGRLFLGGYLTASFRGALRDGQEQVCEVKLKTGLLRVKLTPDNATRSIAARIIEPDDTEWTAQMRLASYHATRSPAPHVGRCHAVARTTGSNTDDPAPDGNAYARLSFSKAGRFTCAGRLGDGTPFSVGGVVAPSPAGDSFGVAIPMRTSRDPAGSILCLHNGIISRDPGDRRLRTSFEAEWGRETNSRRAEYPAGFWLSLSMAGGEYRAPARGSTALPMGRMTVNLDRATPDLTLTHQVVLGADHRFTVLDPGSDKLQLRLIPSNGLLSGSFIDPATGKKVLVQGLVEQIGGEARGCFRSGRFSGAIEVTAD